MKEMTFEQAVKELELCEPCSEEPLAPERLLEILKEDVVQVMVRPGSWEGSNMEQVLRSHGFLT